MTPEEARAKYEEQHGVISDEEWAEIAADVEDWDAFFAAQEEAVAPVEDGGEAAPEEPTGEEGDGDGETLASLASRVGTIEDRLDEALGLLRQQQLTEEQKVAAAKHAKAVGEIAATEIEVRGAKHRLAASSVDVLATAMADPSEDNVAAILEHVKANGGRFSVIPTHPAPALDPNKKVGDPDEDVLATWADDPEATKAITDTMKREGITAKEAERKYVGRGAGKK
jgi:hypothetical protein